MKICSPAKNKIKTAYSGLTFKEQCTNLEKVIFHFFSFEKIKIKTGNRATEFGELYPSSCL